MIIKQLFTTSIVYLLLAKQKLYEIILYYFFSTQQNLFALIHVRCKFVQSSYNIYDQVLLFRKEQTSKPDNQVSECPRGIVVKTMGIIVLMSLLYSTNRYE